MFLFKKHKQISHQQASVIGFVLAIMSALTTVVVMYLIPVVMNWVHSKGLFGLDGFYLGFGVTIFLAVQALLLFGFPLYYAQDKKSHMTGFQILVYSLLWLLIFTVVGTLVGIGLSHSPQALPLGDFGQPGSFDVVPSGDAGTALPQ